MLSIRRRANNPEEILENRTWERQQMGSRGGEGKLAGGRDEGIST